MPQTLEQLLLTRPKTNTTPLPTQGPQTWLDPILQGTDTALGLERQAPGSLPAAIGAAAGTLFPSLARILPFRKAAQVPQDLEVLKAAIASSPRMKEFQAMPEAGTLNDLPQIEVDKVMDLSKPRPQFERK